MNQYVLYHNPNCSKSRAALDLLRSQNIEPKIVLYLETPPDKNTLIKLLSALNMKAEELIRQGESEFKTLLQTNKSLTEDDYIHAMLKYPRLIERPIFTVGAEAVIGRPPERVLELLE